MMDRRMKEEKRYYWLKLPERFFEEPEIKKLRRIAGGDTYTIIYLKLLLLSLENGGRLFYDGLEDTIHEELALNINEDPDNVRVTIMYLIKFRLMVEVSDIEMLMGQVPEMTGSETDAARRMRKSRNRKSIECNNVTPMLHTVTQYKSKIIDTDNYDDDDAQTNIIHSLHTRIDYSGLCEEMGYLHKSILDDIVADMIDVYTTTSNTISIKKDETYPAEYVRARYDTITRDTVVFILERLLNADIKTNARSYIRTVTYNATMCIDTQYNADARHGR